MGYNLDKYTLRWDLIMLKITDVRVKVLTGDTSKLCAVASIIIDDAFVIQDI